MQALFKTAFVASDSIPLAKVSHVATLGEKGMENRFSVFSESNSLDTEKGDKLESSSQSSQVSFS